MSLLGNIRFSSSNLGSLLAKPVNDNLHDLSEQEIERDESLVLILFSHMPLFIDDVNFFQSCPVYFADLFFDLKDLKLLVIALQDRSENQLFL